MPEVYSDTSYAEGYPEGIDLHFWHAARTDLVYRWLVPRLREGDLVMDIGCGTGLVVKALRERQINVKGVELGDAPVVPAVRGDVYTKTDVFDLPGYLKLQIDGVLLLDVIEHMEERNAFIRRIYLECPKCRFILVTVPARMEIWSSYDEYWGHRLRYDRQTLAAELEEGGFHPVRTRYFFHWLYLASLAMRILGIAKSPEFQPLARRGPRALFHRLLGWITRMESRLVPGRVAGSSLACLAVRNR